MHPPPFNKLLFQYRSDPKSAHLRFGQWFIVNYLREVNNPTLFYEVDIANCLDIIEEYYRNYQWEL
jgi:hypothetical protein